MTTKLDGKFYSDGIYKAKDNSRVPEDEWIVFLAKDNAFAAMLPLYHAECMRLGADAEQMAAVERLLERVDAWREANPDKCKTPDAAGERMLDSEMRP